VNAEIGVVRREVLRLLPAVDPPAQALSPGMRCHAIAGLALLVRIKGKEDRRWTTRARSCEACFDDSGCGGRPHRRPRGHEFPSAEVSRLKSPQR
jgi:hypothetical protein